MDPQDIEKMMSIVATFGGATSDLIEIKKYILNEIQEIGDNRLLREAEGRSPGIKLYYLQKRLN